MLPLRPRALAAAALCAALLLLVFAWTRLDPRAPLEAPPADVARVTPPEDDDVVVCEEILADFLSDSPFDSDAFHDVSGGAGGAAGAFGGRRSFGSSPVARRRAAPREEYVAAREVGFRDPREHPLSTFSVDVDTASYANVRRFLEQGQLPPPEAVRVEELINAFDYGYESPRGEHPLALHAEVASCPWNPRARLLRLALQAERVAPEARRPLNLVFLIDVSGSMQHELKLPLVQEGLRELARRLDARDTVGIVTYANGVETALEPVPGDHTEAILAVVDRLRAKGGTNGEGGIQRAYELALAWARPEAESRVLLATDGDFNVGISDRALLIERIREKADLGVSLTVLGFGYGNLKDATLEQLADHGDGHYAYVDSALEARRLFGDGFAGSLVTAARDVKVQVELNPALVQAYRLIGYANRRLADRDFADDAKDAGDVGVGHAVTALYEIVPHGERVPLAAMDAEPGPGPITRAGLDDELCAVSVRYKPRGAAGSVELRAVVRDAGLEWTSASSAFQLAAAVAMIGETLAHSAYTAPEGIERGMLVALATIGDDPEGERTELLDLARRARALRASYLLKPSLSSLGAITARQ